MGVAKVANNWASEASPVQSRFRVIYICNSYTMVVRDYR